MCVDVLQDGFERGVVAHAQILDLDLTLPGPAVRDLGRSWTQGERQGDEERERERHTQETERDEAREGEMDRERGRESDTEKKTELLHNVA